jgi:hypothetical protein
MRGGFGPSGIRIVHIVVEGDYAQRHFPDFVEVKGADAFLKVHVIAAYWAIHMQARSAWTYELDLRPFKEPF